MPTIEQQLDRFVANEPRLDLIVNGGETLDVTLADGTKQPTLRKLLAGIVAGPPAGWIERFRASGLSLNNKGDPGAAGNVASTLADLRAAPTTNITMLYDGKPYVWTAGNYTGRDDGVTVVKANSTPLNAGAWVRAENVLNLAAFGFSPNRSGAENLALMKMAVASAREGDTIFLPNTGDLFCPMSNAGQLADAVQITKRLNFRFDGNIKATNTGAIGPNPSCLFNNTAKGTTFSGNGRIAGNGQFIDQNAGDDDTIPSLIRNTADDFTLTGITIEDPAKVGLLLYGCKRAIIANARFVGGPAVYTDTAHFSIRAPGGGFHIFMGNQFCPNATGGAMVQCIFLTGSNHNIFTANIADRFFEKLIYGFGDYNLCFGNQMRGYKGDFIPGTNIEGNITAPIRFHGSHNKVFGNMVRWCAGGAQLMDGTNNELFDNSFKEVGQSAASMYNSNLKGVKCRNNIGTCGNLKGVVISAGLYISADAPSNSSRSDRVDIDNNDISGFSVADPLINIEVWAKERTLGMHSNMKPSTPNSRYYTVKVPGKTGTTEPNWPAGIGVDVQDGTVVWTSIGFEGGQPDIMIVGGGDNKQITNARIRNNKTGPGRFGIKTIAVIYSDINKNEAEATEACYTEVNGAYNNWMWNTQNGGADGIVGLSATSGFLNYEETDWVPPQGSGLNVQGEFSSYGRKIRHGRYIELFGTLKATASIGTTGGKISVLPIAVFPNSESAGTLSSASLGSGSTAVIASADNNALFGSAMAQTAYIFFHIKYRIA